MTNKNDMLAREATSVFAAIFFFFAALQFKPASELRHRKCTAYDNYFSCMAAKERAKALHLPFIAKCANANLDKPYLSRKFSLYSSH